MCWQFKQGHHCIPLNAIYWVAGLCVIGGGVISSTSEPSLIIIWSIILLSKTLLLALGTSALDVLSTGVCAHNRVKKISNSLPILLCSLWCPPSACTWVSPVLARPLVGGSGINDRLVPAGYSFRKYHVVVKWVGWVYIALLLAINNNDWWWIAADILLSVFSQLIIIIIIIINPNACFLATFVNISASFCFLRSAIIGGSTTLVCHRPRNVFSSQYCWVLRASHILISDGLHMSFFFSP